MTETPETWRTFAALLELHRDEEPPFSTNEVSTQSGVSIGATERELERLAWVDAVTLDDGGGEEAVRLSGLSVEAAGGRLETLAALSSEEYDALTTAIENGNVDPSERLGDVHEARDAAERALGTQQSQ